MADTTTASSGASLDEIRREVIESRNLVIKTDNLLKNLHAELKLVGKRQEEFARRQWVSSAVAYLAFVGLCVAGVVAISNARSAQANQERERLEKQVAELTAAADKQKAEIAAAVANERQAADVYRLMTTLTGDDRLKAIDALAKIDMAKLPVFTQRALQDRALLLRKEVGAATLERGKAAFRRQDYNQAIEELTRFMTLQPTEDDANEASYFLGNALVQQRKFEEGATALQRFVQADRRAKNRDYAMLMLSQAYEASNQHDKAVEVAREALNTYPTSEFANGYRLRLRGPTAPAAAPAPAAAAPAAEAPRTPLKPPAAPAPATPARP